MPEAKDPFEAMRDAQYEAHHEQEAGGEPDTLNTEAHAATIIAGREETQQVLASDATAHEGEIAALHQSLGVTPKGDGESVVQEKLSEDIVEKLGAPKSEIFKQYGNAMRRDASALVPVVEQMRENKKKLNETEWHSPEWQKLWNENEALNDQRNALRDGAVYGRGIMSRDADSGKDDRLRNAYKEAAMDDPQTVLSLAQAGELGGGYRENEGIGKISRRLRREPEYMMKVLESLSPLAAEGFYPNVLQPSRELYVAAVRKNHLNYQFGPKEWARDPEIQKIAVESGLDPMYLMK